MNHQEQEVRLLNVVVEAGTILRIKNVKYAWCNVKLVLINLIVLLVDLIGYYKIKLNVFVKMDTMKHNNFYVNNAIINVVLAKMML